MPAKGRKKASSKAKVTRRPQDAVALLRADHALVQDLFEQFEKARKTKLDLRALGEQLGQRKEQLQSQMSTPSW